MDDMPPVAGPELRPLVTALSNVIQRIIERLRALREYLSGQPVGNVGTPSEWENLERISHVAATTVRRLERELTSRRAPGRPKNFVRQRFAQDVAIVLKRNGVRVTTSRSESRPRPRHDARGNGRSRPRRLVSARQARITLCERSDTRGLASHLVIRPGDISSIPTDFRYQQARRCDAKLKHAQLRSERDGRRLVVDT